MIERTAIIAIPTGIKDQRHCLSDDLDKWLENNSPTVLDRGVSLGNIRFVDNASAKRNIEREKKAEQERIAMNERISAAKKNREDDARIKNEMLAQAKKDKESIIAQAIVLIPFYEKAKSQDITMLCNIVGVNSVQLKKAIDKKALPDGRLKLIEKALVNFEWFTPKPKTRGKHKSNKSRKKLSKADIERKERWHIVNNARKEAQAKGLKEFTAICAYHGETRYIVASNGYAKCSACRYENSKRYNEKTQTREQKETFERRKRNNAAMKSALSDGLDKFNGECDKHGKVEFSIQRKKKEYTGTYPYQYKCIHCRLENSRLHAEKRKKLRLEGKG
jgi:hypothetical protein